MDIMKSRITSPYSVPLYRIEGFIEETANFIRLNVKNETIEKAYRHLVHKFGYYLMIKHGVLLERYDTATGMLHILLPIQDTEKIDVWSEFSNFVNEYFIPKLRTMLNKATTEEVLSAWYRKSGEGSPTGLAPAVMLKKHALKYPDVLGNFNVQKEKSQKKEKRMVKTSLMC